MSCGAGGGFVHCKCSSKGCVSCCRVKGVPVFAKGALLASPDRIFSWNTSSYIPVYSSCAPSTRRMWNCWGESRDATKFLGGLEHILYGDRIGAGAVQPREEEVVWRPQNTSRI